MTDFEISVLASGSKGNATLLRAGGTSILIDAGISCRRLVQGLRSCGVEPEELAGVFLTHEHRDHVAGLEIFCKHHAVPVFANERTWRGVQCRSLLPRTLIKAFPRTLELGRLRVESFHTSHDALDPVGYCFYLGKRKCTYLTDCGFVTKECLTAAEGAECIILEANHDVDLLVSGPYPRELQQRILGRRGHLSNEMAGELLMKLPKLPEELFLAHLSQENNTPDTALSTIRRMLCGLPGFNEMKIYVTSQEAMVSNKNRRVNYEQEAMF